MFGFKRRRRKAPATEKRPYRDWHDWISIFVETAGLIAIVATIVITLRTNAENGAEMATAIGQMRDIATAMTTAKPLLERQANAAADAASAAKDTAQSAKGQTTAIVKQADALIKSAQATVKAAEAQLASAQANTRTAEAGARAAQAQQRSAEMIAAAQVPSARLATVPIEGLDTPPDAEGKIAVKIKPTYINNGGADLTPIRVTFSLTIGSEIPNVPPEASDHFFGGNEFNVPPKGNFFPLVPYSYKLDSKDVAAVRANKKAIFVWGRIVFEDIRRTQYEVCYGAIVSLPSESVPESTIFRFGPDAYHCGGG